MSNIGNAPATGAQRTLLGIQTLTDGYLTIEGGNITNVGDLDVDNLTVNDTATIQNMVVISTIADNISANNYYGGFISTSSAYHLNLSVNTVNFNQQVGNFISTTNLLYGVAQGVSLHTTYASITTASIENLYTMSLNVSNVITNTLRCSVASISTLYASTIGVNTLVANNASMNYLSVTQTIFASNLLVSNIEASTISTNWLYTSFLSCSVAYFDRIDSCNVITVTTANISDAFVSFLVANSIYTSYISTNYGYSESGMIRNFNAETTTTNTLNTNYSNTGFMNIATLVTGFANVQTLRTDKALQAAIYTPLSAGDDARDYYSVTFDDDYLYFRTTSGLWKKIALTPF